MMKLQCILTILNLLLVTGYEDLKQNTLKKNKAKGAAKYFEAKDLIKDVENMTLDDGVVLIYDRDRDYITGRRLSTLSTLLKFAYVLQDLIDKETSSNNVINNKSVTEKATATGTTNGDSVINEHFKERPSTELTDGITYPDIVSGESNGEIKEYESLNEYTNETDSKDINVTKYDETNISDGIRDSCLQRVIDSPVTEYGDTNNLLNDKLEKKRPNKFKNHWDHENDDTHRVVYNNFGNNPTYGKPNYGPSISFNGLLNRLKMKKIKKSQKVFNNIGSNNVYGNGINYGPEYTFII